MRGLNITICGCGNGAHAAAALFANKGHKVKIFSPIEKEIELFKEKSPSGEIEAILPDNSKIKESISLVTHNAKDGIEGATIVFIIVPAFAHENIFESIAPYLSENSTVVIIPTRSGMEFQAKSILPDCNIIGLQTLPWACRIIDFGREVDIIGKKEEIQAASIPSEISEVILYQLEELLDMNIKASKNMLTLTLGNVGQIIHPGIMYGIFKNNPKEIFKSEKDIPLFYQSVDDEIASILESISNEIQSIAKEIEIRTNGALLSVEDVPTIEEWILNSYRDQIKDKSKLSKMFSTNEAYRGLKVPYSKLDENKYVANFNYRYITEDVPYGLLVTKYIGNLYEVETPTIDIVIKSLGEWVSIDYYDLLNKTLELSNISRVPILYGIRDIKHFEDIYS